MGEFDRAMWNELWQFVTIFIPRWKEIFLTRSFKRILDIEEQYHLQNCIDTQQAPLDVPGPRRNKIWWSTNFSGFWIKSRRHKESLQIRSIICTTCIITLLHIIEGSQSYLILIHLSYIFNEKLKIDYKNYYILCV